MQETGSASRVELNGAVFEQINLIKNVYIQNTAVFFIYYLYLLVGFFTGCFIESPIKYNQMRGRNVKISTLKVCE